MTAKQIQVGKRYQAKVNGRLTVVRVDQIMITFSGRPGYHVTNLATGRNTYFRSAAKFRAEAN
jgi:hypothetical protein